MLSTAAKFRWALTLAIIAAMVVVSLLPEPYKDIFSTVGATHLIVHIVAFFVLGVLGASALTSLGKQLLFSAALVAIGGLIEVLQGHFYHNPVEYEDIAADVLGVAMALLFAVIWRRAASSAADSA